VVKRETEEERTLSYSSPMRNDGGFLTRMKKKGNLSAVGGEAEHL
jgi:hypothetical protein